MAYGTRDPLPAGTRIQLNAGVWYEITGGVIGRGGGSLLYPASRLVERGGKLTGDGFSYALKECFPASSGHSFVRNKDGAVVPEEENPAEFVYLDHVQRMMLREETVTKEIYRTSTRMLPVRESAESVLLQMPGGKPRLIHNAYIVMESLASKGRSLTSYVEDAGRLSCEGTFHVIRDVLFALREVHSAGYLHLDIQDGNVFLNGALDGDVSSRPGEESNTATLIDFGSARRLMSDGQTAVVQDRAVFTTEGYSAPEILLHCELPVEVTLKVPLSYETP